MALWLTFDHAGSGQIAQVYLPVNAHFPGWAAAGAVALSYVLYARHGIELIQRRFLDTHFLKFLTIPFALVSGTMEELWFRRVLMDRIMEGGGGIALQIGLSALSFGLVHAIWGLFARRWRVAVNATVATSFLGLGLAIVYLLNGRQVGPCVWAHTTINIAIEPWLLMSALQTSSVQLRGKS